MKSPKSPKSPKKGKSSIGFETDKSPIKPEQRKPTILKKCLVIFGVLMDIFDSYSDLALIIDWYGQGDVRLAGLLFSVMLLSNLWSVWVLHVHKFNIFLSFIFGICGFSTILTSFRAFKENNFEAPYFRKVKYYHALFESLPSGAIILYRVYIENQNFFGTFSGYKFLFGSSFGVAWNAKSYILDNSYFGKTITESKLVFPMWLKYLLVFILFSDYFARTFSLVIVLALEQFEQHRIISFTVTFTVGFLIEWIFVRLLMIQIRRYSLRNTHSARGARVASSETSPQMNAVGSSSPRGKNTMPAMQLAISSSSVGAASSPKGGGNNNKSFKNSGKNTSSKNVSKNGKNSIGSEEESRIKSKLCDNKGCLSNRTALFFSWIQLLSGMFTYHALFVCATMEENEGRCNKDKCCKYISWIAYCEIFLRLTFPIATVYVVNDGSLQLSEVAANTDWVNYTIFSFGALVFFGAIFSFCVCWIEKPLKRR